MRFIATADSDVGITKDINQDSVLIEHAKVGDKEVLMTIICDGMGGLALGELASATVIRTFAKWFKQELPYELKHLDMHIIAEQWSFMLKETNIKILEYSKAMKGQGIGTTFTGMLFVDNQYLIVHVGDTRAYRIGDATEQLTMDQTFVAREISRGTMTLEEAKRDRRRNMLLQCVGASKTVEPEILYGETQKGVYMLCSDGFRHEISEQEIYQSLNAKVLQNKGTMHLKAKQLIDLVKSRNEKDNISVILVKVE